MHFATLGVPACLVSLPFWQCGTLVTPTGLEPVFSP